MSNPFPFFSVHSRKLIGLKTGSLWVQSRIEERITITFTNQTLTRPVFKVTNEHRQRWPNEYKAFRSGLSWWMKLRLWFQGRRDRPAVSAPFNEAFESEFNEALTGVIKQNVKAQDDHTADIRRDLYAACQKRTDLWKA